MKKICFLFLCFLLSLPGLRAEDGNPAEAIVDSGRWVIHFTEMTEDEDNRNTFRNMDASQNFLLIEGDSCTLQIATRGAERVPWGKKKYRILYSPHDNGLKGITLKRKLIDRIRISPDNTWSSINIPGLARMRGKGVEMW